MALKMFLPMSFTFNANLGSKISFVFFSQADESTVKQPTEGKKITLWLYQQRHMVTTLHVCNSNRKRQHKKNHANMNADLIAGRMQGC